VLVEPGTLELAVHIGGEHARRTRLGPSPEHGEAGVRHRSPVECQPMAVETPGQRGIVVEVNRVGQLLEPQPQPLVRGIGPPEAPGAPEVG
jgi:hypothetical protein